jgi:hypothetical protein
MFMYRFEEKETPELLGPHFEGLATLREQGTSRDSGVYPLIDQRLC